MDEVDHIVSFSFDRFHIGRRRVWVFTVFFFLCYYMLLPAHFGFLGMLRDSFYICIVPVLVAAVLYFRRFRDGTEFKLLFAFWIWFWKFLTSLSSLRAFLLSSLSTFWALASKADCRSLYISYCIIRVSRRR